MNFGFWQQLERPLVVLAPLAGVTDAAFRAVIARYGKPPVMWTEFVPAEGLMSRGRDKIIHDLWKSAAEHPIVAQIYGGKPEAFRGAAELVAELGYDGVDINMGCPTRAVEKHCAGSALIRQPSLAQEIIAAAKEGAGSLPVSVKTRIGYKHSEIEQWIAALIEAEPALITIHARTRNDMSRVSAKWDEVKRAVQLAQAMRPETSSRPLIFGNGDVLTPPEAIERASEAGCDGVMIGRGIFGNPWLFGSGPSREERPLGEVLSVMLEHTELYERLFSGRKSLALMKKHYKAYLAGFYGTALLRAALMDSMDYSEIYELIRQHAATYGHELVVQDGLEATVLR